MDYFALFDLPVRLQPDEAAVRKKYFALSRETHPDYFTAAPPAERQQALERSAQLNKALKTLTNRDETIKYVLMQKGLLTEDEKYTLPPAFLMQMMEINEAAADAALSDDAASTEALRQTVNEAEKEIYTPVAAIIENYRDGETTTEELERVKDYYFKKKYLERLRRQLSQKA